MLALMCLLFGRPLANYAYEIISYLALASVAFIIISFVDENQNRLFKFIRLLYPLFIFGPLYRLTDGTMQLLSGSFFDFQLTSLEESLFGQNPTLFIDQHLLSVWSNEILSFCYFAYYVIIPGFFFTAFYRKDYDIIKSVLSGVCLTYLLSYLLFVLYPVEGPRWFFANLYANNIDGLLFRDMVVWIIGNGAIHGGAMPSSHTGVVLAIMIYSFKYYRTLGWILLPIVLGLSLGTVWGRFHYVSDVIIGAAIALVAMWLADKYYHKLVRPRYNEYDETKLEVKNAT